MKRPAWWRGCAPLAAVGVLAACADEAPPATTGASAAATSETAPKAATLAAPIDPALSALSDRFSRGFAATPRLFAGELEEGDHHDEELLLPSGRCYRVLAVGRSGLEDLDLSLLDGSGGVLHQDAGGDAAPVLGLTPPICPEVPTVYQLRFRAHRGSGAYRAQLFGS